MGAPPFSRHKLPFDDSRQADFVFFCLSPAAAMCWYRQLCWHIFGLFTKNGRHPPFL